MDCTGTVNAFLEIVLFQIFSSIQKYTWSTVKHRKSISPLFFWSQSMVICLIFFLPHMRRSLAAVQTRGGYPFPTGYSSSLTQCEVALSPFQVLHARVSHLMALCQACYVSALRCTKVSLHGSPILHCCMMATMECHNKPSCHLLTTVTLIYPCG